MSFRKGSKQSKRNRSNDGGKILEGKQRDAHNRKAEPSEREALEIRTMAARSFTRRKRPKRIKSNGSGANAGSSSLSIEEQLQKQREKQSLQLQSQRTVLAEEDQDIPSTPNDAEGGSLDNSSKLEQRNRSMYPFMDGSFLNNISSSSSVVVNTISSPQQRVSRLIDGVIHHLHRGVRIHHLDRTDMLSHNDMLGSFNNYDMNFMAAGRRLDWCRSFDILDEREHPFNPDHRSPMPAYLSVYGNSGGVRLQSNWASIMHVSDAWSVVQLTRLSHQSLLFGVGFERSRNTLRFQATRTGSHQSDIRFKVPYQASPFAVHDICWKKDEPVAVVVYNQSSHHGTVFGSNVTESGDGDHVWLKCDRLPSSELLCVRNGTRDEFLIGHRNGQISRMDWRTHEITSTTAAHVSKSHVNNSDVFGPVYSIHAIRNGEQHVVRSMFGRMCLYDAREPTKTLCEYEYPTTALPRLTNKCIGIATNPGENVVMSPFVNTDESPVPCMGLWNLQSGQLIRHVPLATEAEADQLGSSVVNGIRWVELCEKRTFGYYPGNDMRKRTFGIWYKCGIGGGDVSGVNLHHISFPERLL